MIRAFFALTLPDTALDQIERLQAAIPFGRAAPAENLHLTLAFLGEVSPETLEAAHEAAETLAPPPFALELRGLVHLGRQPGGVIASGVVPEPRLDGLAKSLRSRLAGTGIQLPRERFRPHVTLIRLRQDDADDATLARILGRHADFRAGPIPVTGLSLFRSYLGGDSARHEELARYSFDPADLRDVFSR
ncbi:RNA 2',3'-cyclic phosphodiesterase [Defluviimonas sp. WL0002]|uniref:RNA 2',3'-cyclic phosphodiesterase n=1 Tax=Albidovulum marisflavi TaxID=2984159 RepID=A0ABT2ZHH6_9RHOB|nr:RNA 2',3'-cyclic phosphodiesterase [Defluviimonas sp. WL0002]MCV2870490.1 RNA 2',3'-cyclic phosphodiesterase [Defluviimonas sp. WL0002]